MHDLYVTPIGHSKACVAARQIAEIEEEAPSLPRDRRPQAADPPRAVESLPEPQRSVLALVTWKTYGTLRSRIYSEFLSARDRLAAAAEPVALSPVLRRVKWTRRNRRCKKMTCMPTLTVGSQAGAFQP
jgi:hypothetical protein